MQSWKSCHCLQVVLFLKLRPARHVSATRKSSISLFYPQTYNPPSPSQPDCFVPLLLCALLSCSFPPCAIRHKPFQKLQTGRGIEAHQLQSQNGKTSLSLRSVIWSEQHSNAWESPSDEILTSTAPRDERFKAQWKISEVTLRQPLQQHHWEVKEQTKRNHEDDNKSYQARQRTELEEKDDHRIQVKVIMRNTCNCINYQRIHGGEVFSAKRHGLAAKKIIMKCACKNELCIATGKEATLTLQISKCRELQLSLEQSNHPKNLTAAIRVCLLPFLTRVFHRETNVYYAQFITHIL